MSAVSPPPNSPVGMSFATPWSHALWMPTTKPVPMPPKLHLTVQYATPAPELPRWRLRRWVQHGLHPVANGTATGPTPFQAAGLTLRLVDTQVGRELNHAYRGRNYATIVLTFEYGTDPQGTVRADIVLCVPVLHNEAREQGKPVLHHAAHLVVHGVLHALGYDHLTPEEAEHMEGLETRVLARLGIPDPYQVI